MKYATVFLLPTSLAVAAALPTSTLSSNCVSRTGTQTPCPASLPGTFIGVKASLLASKTGTEACCYLSQNDTSQLKQLHLHEVSHRPTIHHGRSPNSTFKHVSAQIHPNNATKIEESFKTILDMFTGNKAVKDPKAGNKETEKKKAENDEDSTQPQGTTKPGKEEEEGEEKFPVRPYSQSISSDEVVQRFQDVQTSIPKLVKVFKRFGMEGSGMRPDREKAKNFKNIQNWLNEWTVGIRDLQNRLQATTKWDLVGQMKVAQQYFKYAGDVEMMLKAARKHVGRFDKSSHMRCEVATRLAILYNAYAAVADHLYTTERLTGSHHGGRLLRSKFYRPLPMWWDITAFKDPKSGERIADWTKWNDSPYDPASGEFEITLRKWEVFGATNRVGNCSEMEPHGTW